MTETMKEERDELRASRAPCMEVTNGQVRALLNDADTLAHIESQILYRDESMPEWAQLWWKDSIGDCLWVGQAGYRKEPAPDYRPDQDGPITLAILSIVEEAE